MIGYFLLGGLFGAILGYAISDLMNLYDKEMEDRNDKPDHMQ